MVCVQMREHNGAQLLRCNAHLSKLLGHGLAFFHPRVIKCGKIAGQLPLHRRCVINAIGAYLAAPARVDEHLSFGMLNEIRRNRQLDALGSLIENAAPRIFQVHAAAIRHGF